MKVCHFCTTTTNTAYFKNICKELDARGVSVLCADLTKSEPPAWLSETQRVRYLSLGAKSRLGYFWSLLKLVYLLRYEKVDVLQTHLFDAGLVGVTAARLARTPVVVLTRHHSDQVKMLGTRLHVMLDRWMAKKADGVVAVSHAVKNYMISEETIGKAKIDVIQLGFDFEALRADVNDRDRIRTEFGLSQKFVIGCIASFSHTKGHSYLLHALKAIVEEIPQVCLLLLGAGNRTKLDVEIKRLGLTDRVVFAGFRKDVAACIAAMDLVVHPSLSEAFCQVLVETMSVGVPLIATNVGGASEVIKHAETGLLIPAADSGAITRAVLELYRNPKQRQRVALAGQESVRAQFKVERMVNLQIDCYQRLLAQKLNKAETYVAT